MAQPPCSADSMLMTWARQFGASRMLRVRLPAGERVEQAALLLKDAELRRRRCLTTAYARGGAAASNTAGSRS